jgi:FHS family L-fucose permease-like MFS transporter
MKAYTTYGEKASGYFLTGSLVALGLGRVFSTALMRFVDAAKLMRIYAFLNIALVLFASLHPGFAGAMALLMTSFFMSIMFPTIFALGVKGLGSDTKLGGSLIVMAILGGAIFPPLVGVVERATGSLAHGYMIVAVGYVVVAAYGFMGSGVSEREVEAAPIV